MVDSATYFPKRGHRVIMRNTSTANGVEAVVTAAVGGFVYAIVGSDGGISGPWRRDQLQFVGEDGDLSLAEQIGSKVLDDLTDFEGTIGDLADKLCDLAMAYGHGQRVRLDAGASNVEVRLC